MNKAIIFDLDGTIYLGNDLIEGVSNTIDILTKYGFKIIYFTNNSSKTRSEIRDKLITLGLNTTVNQIYTSSYATAIYLSQQQLTKIFLIGSNGLKKELESMSIELVDEYSAQAVVIGLKNNFTYNDIAKALVAVNNGAQIIASNADANYPAENGILKPGANAILGSLLGACEKNADYIVGKPNTFLLKIIADNYLLSKEDIWIVGDRLDSDIAMANNYGCKSILVGSEGIKINDITKLIIKE